MTSLGRARTAVALLVAAILSIDRLGEVLERISGEVGVFGMVLFGWKWVFGGFLIHWWNKRVLLVGGEGDGFGQFSGAEKAEGKLVVLVVLGDDPDVIIPEVPEKRFQGFGKCGIVV